MSSFTASPAMLTALIVVLILNSVSLLLLALNVQVFLHQNKKYLSWLRAFGDEQAWGHPGRLWLVLYIILTITGVIISTTLFVWQPHFF